MPVPMPLAPRRRRRVAARAGLWTRSPAGGLGDSADRSTAGWSSGVIVLSPGRAGTGAVSQALHRWAAVWRLAGAPADLPDLRDGRVALANVLMFLPDRPVRGRPLSAPLAGLGGAGGRGRLGGDRGRAAVHPGAGVRRCPTCRQHRSGRCSGCCCWCGCTERRRAAGAPPSPGVRHAGPDDRRHPAHPMADRDGRRPLDRLPGTVRRARRVRGRSRRRSPADRRDAAAGRRGAGRRLRHRPGHRRAAPPRPPRRRGRPGRGSGRGGPRVVPGVVVPGRRPAVGHSRSCWPRRRRRPPSTWWRCPGTCWSTWRRGRSEGVRHAARAAPARGADRRRVRHRPALPAWRSRRDAAALGLAVEHRFATWDMAPWAPGADWCVTVLRAG